MRGAPDPRTVALWGILLLGVFHTLHAARALFLPIVLALLANLALTPVVRAMARVKLPRPLAAGLLLAVLVSAGGAGVAALSSPAAAWVERAPRTLRQVEHKLRPIRAPVEQIARATREVQEATTIDEAPARQVSHVTVSEPSLFADLVLQTRGFLAAMVVTLVLLFFLLASEDGIARVLAAGPRWLRGDGGSRQMVRAIEGDVSRHLLTISLVNLALGCVVAVALALLGMPNPALWGAMAAVLNYVPFLGAIVGTAVVTIVALISFEQAGDALVVAAVFAGLTAFEGLLVTPAVLGKRLLLSPVAVFVSILVWSWLWGVPGAVLAVPVLAVMKLASDRIEGLRGLSVMLGR